MDSYRIPLFDVILTLGGNRLDPQLFKSRRAAAVVQVIVRFVLVSSAVIFLCNDLQKGQTYSLDFLNRRVLESCCVLHMMLFAKRRQRIRLWLTHVTDQQSMICLKAYSIKLFVFYASFIGYQLLIESVFLFSVSSVTVADFRDFAISIPFMLNNYMIVYPLFYLLMIKILTRFQVKRLQAIAVQTKKAQLVDFRKMLNQLRVITDAHQEFERLFNVIPFSLMATMFSLIPSAVSFIEHSARQHDSARVSLGVIHLATGNVFLISMICSLIYAACHSKRETAKASRQANDALVQTVAASTPTTAQLQVMDDLKRIEFLPLTGLGLFNVTPSLILTFFSSLITFSVLICQLASVFA